jgi:hypothetical protein
METEGRSCKLRWLINKVSNSQRGRLEDSEDKISNSGYRDFNDEEFYRGQPV